MSVEPGSRGLLPVACTLGADDGAQRLEEWRDVVRRFGVGTRRVAGRVTLGFRDAPGVAAELERLVAAERSCCAFLDWTLTHTDDEWVVVIAGGDDELATVSLGELS